MTLGQMSTSFFLQVFFIVAACRLAGMVARRVFDQPQVVGEMIAGIVLGPSLFGLWLPELQNLVFPKDTKSVLYVAAQLGVGLYMFLVGLGFRSEHFRHNARSAVAVSLSGMVVPFAAGMALTPWLMKLSLFGEAVHSTNAALFMGAAISITAFPVLARIIQERGLARTPLGSMALSSGAVDDAGAWTVLAVVLASLDGSPVIALKALIGGGAFAIAMTTVAPRLLRRLGDVAERDGAVSPALLAVVVMLFALSAWAMDAAGLHAAFGGFLLGAAMPRGVLTREVERQLTPMTVGLLVPLFFTYSGLNTQLGLVNSWTMGFVTLVILACSILAKGGACWAAARLTGQDNATALGIGALMNTRGLMELIIINIGLQRGIIGPALFSMLALMAILTTMLTSPVLERVYARKARRAGELGELVEELEGRQAPA